MNPAPFETLLKDTIGLDAASIGVSAIERAVKARALACDAGDQQAYLERVRTSPAELNELIDAVVIPETWFFRDRGAFDVLARVARGEGASGKERIRILSFPCATGEEPYSIVMTMVEAGLGYDRFRVDAFDVSHRVIARAVAALYGKNSFRGADLTFRDRYFAREGDGYRLAKAIRDAVHFRQGNLLRLGWIGQAAYDVVFCRNLLIYFDATTQERALAILGRLVRPGGHLFVGPSEANLVGGRDFEPVKVPMAFAFRKQSTISIVEKPAQSRAHWPLPAALQARRAAVGEAAAPRPFVAPQPPSAPRGGAATRTDRDLGPIQRLADAGHFAEAARLCEAHLSEAGPSPDALVLLALIRDAAGNAAEAIELYRKALYLDPHQESALAHLRLRLAQKGDEAGAKRLDDRMRRIAERRAE